MEPASPKLPGRPRDEQADPAILKATRELIAETGARDLRMSDVAERAGVGKATIYRRYESKEQLVTAVIAAFVSDIEIPDTGSTQADLLALMRGAVERYARSDEGAIMPSLVDAMSRDPELARAVREGFLAERRAALREVVERGIERGDLSADLDHELVLDVFAGPLFYRLLVTGGPIDDQLAEGVVKLVLRGFGP